MQTRTTRWWLTILMQGAIKTIWEASAMSSPRCTLLASPMKWTLPLSASHRWMEALLDRTLMGRKCPLSMYRSQKSLQLLQKVSLQQMLRLKLLHQPNL